MCIYSYMFIVGVFLVLGSYECVEYADGGSDGGSEAVALMVAVKQLF